MISTIDFKNHSGKPIHLLRSVLAGLTVIFVFFDFAQAQSFSLDVKIKNQPDNPVVIGFVRGDKFKPLDTLLIQNIINNKEIKEIKYTFSDKSKTGVYRLVFGQTTYSRVMGESPQQLDFIFNHEDIFFETDFQAPADSLVVLSSEENRLWFAFLAEEKKFDKELKELEKETDYYRNRLTAAGESVTEGELKELKEKFSDRANSFNQLQMEREMFISGLIVDNKGLFAQKMIKGFTEPFRDGFFTPDERRKFYQKEYLKYIDFSDESLINTSVLTDKVFNYLVSYNQKWFTKKQREQAYIEAVMLIMEEVEKVSADNLQGLQKGPMYEFILDYLVNGFEILKMDNVLSFISDNYSDGLCQTDDKTTLVRRLEYQNMKPGTVVPDFTTEDIKGNPVTLSQVIKKRTLIVFWASWCTYCDELLPEIKNWYDQLNSEDLTVVAISLDKSLTDWHKAVVKAGFEVFYNLSDLKEWDGEVTKMYNIYATPTMFLIDSDRRIIARPVTFFELTESMKL